MTNHFIKLKDNDRIMLSVYIDTPNEKEQFPFNEKGLELATKMYMKHIDKIQDDEQEEYTIHLMSDDGISEIQFVSSDRLTKTQLLMWKLFQSGFYNWK